MGKAYSLGAPLRTVEIRLPAYVDCGDVERAIDQALVDVGLHITLRGTLKKFPGCVHWHAKRGRERGTLEITLWPPMGRAWFTIQSGRTADWIDEKLQSLGATIQQRLLNR
jgi:hypothetical protein